MSPFTDLLFADRPFGPTPLSCVGLLLILAGPYLLVAFGCRVAFRGSPSPVWELIAYGLLSAGVAYFYLPLPFPRNVSAFDVATWVAAIMGLVAVPVTLTWDAVRRFRRR